MAVSDPISADSRVSSALAADLRAWLQAERSDWDAAVAAGATPDLPGGADLWNDMPGLDSKVVARSSHIFKQHLGVPLDIKLIRPGGYTDGEAMIADLVPKMVATVSEGSKTSRGGER